MRLSPDAQEHAGPLLRTLCSGVGLRRGLLCWASLLQSKLSLQDSPECVRYSGHAVIEIFGPSADDAVPDKICRTPRPAKQAHLPGGGRRAILVIFHEPQELPCHLYLQSAKMCVGGGGGGMTPDCGAVGSWRRLLASRHLLSLRGRLRPSAPHHLVPFLPLPGLSLPPYSPLTSLLPLPFPLEVVPTEPQDFPCPCCK